VCELRSDRSEVIRMHFSVADRTADVNLITAAKAADLDFCCTMAPELVDNITNSDPFAF